MTIKSLALTGSLAAALLAVPTFAKPAVHASAEASRQSLSVLKDMRELTVEAANYAADLQTLAAGNESSWFSQAGKLEGLKDDINQMGRQLAQLESMRDKLGARDREVVDTATRLLREMAANTQAAIKYGNDNSQRLFTPVYQKYANDLAVQSDQLDNTISHYVTLTNLHEKEKSLRKALASEVGE